MASEDFVSLDFYGTSVERLPPKDAAKCAIVRQPDYLDDLVHGPPVEIFVAHNCEGKLVSVLILLYGLERVITVAGDTLVNGEKFKVEAIIILLI